MNMINTQKEEECCICFEQLTIKFKLECGHDLFHENCINNLMNNTCPLCRTIITIPNPINLNHTHYYDYYNNDDTSDNDTWFINDDGLLRWVRQLSRINEQSRINENRIIEQRIINERNEILYNSLIQSYYEINTNILIPRPILLRRYTFNEEENNSRLNITNRALQTSITGYNNRRSLLLLTN